MFLWWLFFVNREATLWPVSSIKSSRMIKWFSATYRVTTTKDPPRKEQSCTDWCQSRPSKPYFEEQSFRCFSCWIQWTSWGQHMFLQMLSSTSWNSKCPSFRSPNQDVLQTARYDPCILQVCDVGWFSGIGAGVQVERVCLWLTKKTEAGDITTRLVRRSPYSFEDTMNLNLYEDHFSYVRKKQKLMTSQLGWYDVPPTALKIQWIWICMKTTLATSVIWRNTVRATRVWNVTGCGSMLGRCTDMNGPVRGVLPHSSMCRT